MNALIVDDSDAVRGMLVEHLSRLGFVVEQAANGMEALALAARMQTLAIVLLDWDMPGMDGLEVLRRLRAEASTRELPVVMLTTEHELPFVESALNAGASEYLMKPFDAQTVLEKLLLLGVDPEVRRPA